MPLSEKYKVRILLVMGGNVISVTASELKLGCCQRLKRLEVEGLDAGGGFMPGTSASLASQVLCG